MLTQHCDSKTGQFDVAHIKAGKEHDPQKVCVHLTTYFSNMQRREAAKRNQILNAVNLLRVSEPVTSLARKASCQASK
jgi:hypothetical protein